MANRMETWCRQCGLPMRVQPGQAALCPACQTTTQNLPVMQMSGRGAYGQRRPLQNLQRQVAAPQRQLEPPPSPFGRKRAVLCGVNYHQKSYALKGCISDVKSMKSFLIEHMGFPPNSILMLTEEEQSSLRIPTKRNMRKAMRWLVDGNRAGDSLVFHFSGHGSRQKDYDGDEKDGQDEALCPLDHETEGKIIDDEINQILVRPLVHGAKLHGIIDACYSGTVLDLPFVCKMWRNGAYKWEDHRSSVAYKGTDGGAAYCFSACDDHQTSGSTPVFTGKNTGAMTYCFINAVKAEPMATYGRLLALMSYTIRDAQSGHTYNDPSNLQEPLLSSAKKFDINSKRFAL